MKYAPRKVYIKENSVYVELSYRDFCRRRQSDQSYMDKLTGQDEVSKTCSFPKSYVSYRKPRAVSTEQRERARQLMIANNRTKGD